MNYDKLFSDFEVEGFSVFLKHTQPLVKHQPEAAKALEYLYNSKMESIKERMATILNAIFTQNLRTFMISRRTLVDLFKNDEQSKFKNLSSNDYALLLAKITNSNMFQVLRKPTAKKAGVYKLIAPDLVEILFKRVAEEVFEVQEKYVLSYYDRDFEDEKPMTPQEGLVFKEKMKARMMKKIKEQRGNNE